MPSSTARGALSLPSLTLTAAPPILAKKPEETALCYKKGQSRRRRALTGRETADYKETQERNKRHTQLLEQSRNEKYQQTITQEAKNQYIASKFSQRNFPASPQAPQAAGVDSDILNDNNNIQFLGTQPILIPCTQAPRESQKGKGHRISISSESVGNPDDFQDIDDLSLDLPSTPPPPLVSIEGRSQHLSLSQLPPQYRAPTSSAATGTQGAQGEERKKSKKLESQQRHTIAAVAEKAEKAAQRAAAAERKEVRKEVRKIAPRKEDISQLAEQLMGSSL